MDKQIKQKAKRIFAAMLALTITAGTLPYTPLLQSLKLIQ